MVRARGHVFPGGPRHHESDPIGFLVARDLLSHLGSGIESVCGRGEAFDFAGSSAVVIAAMAAPRDEVVERALSTSSGVVVVKGATARTDARLTVLDAEFDLAGRVACGPTG